MNKQSRAGRLRWPVHNSWYRIATLFFRRSRPTADGERHCQNRSKLDVHTLMRVPSYTSSVLALVPGKRSSSLGMAFQQMTQIGKAIC